MNALLQAGKAFIDINFGGMLYSHFRIANTICMQSDREFCLPLEIVPFLCSTRDLSRQIRFLRSIIGLELRAGTAFISIAFGRPLHSHFHC